MVMLDFWTMFAAWVLALAAWVASCAVNRRLRAQIRALTAARREIILTDDGAWISGPSQDPGAIPDYLE